MLDSLFLQSQAIHAIRCHNAYLGDGFACSTHAVRIRCEVFVPLEVPGPNFKPHSALSISQYHGLCANEDASRDDDALGESCLVHFSLRSRGIVIFMGIQQHICTQYVQSAHVAHSCPVDAGVTHMMIFTTTSIGCAVA